MKKTVFDITNLKKAILALSECISAYETNTDSKIQGFIEDSCVKRFEFTVETSWKTMKKYLKDIYGKDDKELTMNNIFRLSEGYGIIHSWEVWRSYYERRNDTSHEYSREKALEIFKIMKNLLQDAEFLYKSLKKELENK